jgi:glutamate/tyrosine decarboxylase-like PLP-dependent enzyme
MAVTGRRTRNEIEKAIVTKSNIEGWNDEAVRGIVDRLATLHRNIPGEPVVRVADPHAIARLRNIEIPSRGRPLEQVVEQMLSDIYPYRMRMDHPRCFAFVPSPSSALSWLGDLLTAAHNPHAGSWLQSSGPSCVERSLIAWLNERIGYPPTAGGLFVSGGSMANLVALTAARDRMLDVQSRPLGVAYVSEQTHSSVAKGLRIIGFVDPQIRKIPTDSQWRLDVDCLAEVVAADRARGLKPFAVVASAGTTNTGSIDPLKLISEVCASNHLWMHVDGAYGASISLSPRHRSLLDGIERADSVSWDAHKWLFQTYGCGMVLVRDERHLSDSFHTNPEYLRDAQVDEDQINYWDFGQELTRPARALKLWLTLQVLGWDGVGEAVAHGFQLACWAADELRQHSDWEIVTPPQLAIVNFRYAPAGRTEAELDELNRAISRRAISEGFAGVLTTKLKGRTVLRICAIHPDAKQSDMRETIRRLNAYGRQEIESGSSG